MPIRLSALVAAVSLAALPAVAAPILYYGPGGDGKPAGQAEFFDSLDLNPTTPYADWSLVFCETGETCELSKPATESDPAVTINEHEKDLVSFEGPALELRPADSITSPNQGFAALLTDSNSLVSATLAVSFPGTAAVGFMLGQSQLRAGAAEVSFFTSTGTFKYTESFGGLQNLVFIGLGNAGAITGLSITVPGVTPDPRTQHFVILGPMQFGPAETGNPVPEPATLALLGAGLLGLGLARRRR